MKFSCKTPKFINQVIKNIKINLDMNEDLSHKEYESLLLSDIVIYINGSLYSVVPILYNLYLYKLRYDIKHFSEYIFPIYIIYSNLREVEISLFVTHDISKKINDVSLIYDLDDNGNLKNEPLTNQFILTTFFNVSDTLLVTSVCINNKVLLEDEYFLNNFYGFNILCIIINNNVKNKQEFLYCLKHGFPQYSSDMYISYNSKFCFHCDENDNSNFMFYIVDH